MINDPAIENLPESEVNNIRRRSAVLSTFPWDTDFIVKDLKVVITDEQFSEYIDSIIRLEENVYSSRSEDLEANRFTSALCRVPAGSIAFPDSTDIKRGQAIKLCETLCAYRLIDVLYLLQEEDATAFERPMYPKWRVSDYLPNQHWPLEDWVTLVTKAKSTMGTLRKYHPPGCPTEEQNALSTTQPSVPLTIKLLRDLHSMSRSQDAIRVLQNFQMAALHIACMLKGTPKEAKDNLAVPNLPANASEWNIEETLSPEEAEFFRNFIRTSEIQKIRHPLYGALLYSPLYLLSSRKLTANAWDQSKMLKLSKALGNRKPAILVKTEVLLWECVMDVATGKAECHISLDKFFSKVDWDALAMVSEADRAHFRDDKALPEISNALISFEGETGIPESWPLYSHRLQSTALRPASGLQTDQPRPSSNTDEPMVLDPRPEQRTGRAESPQNTDDLMPVLDPEPEQHAGRAESPQNIDDPMPVDPDLPEGRRFISKRLNALDQAGRIPNLAGVGASKPPAPRKRKASGGGQMFSSRRIAFVPYQQVQAGVFVQEVRVKTIKKPKVTFKQDTNRNRVTGTEIKVFNALGRSHHWIPEFHFDSDLQHLNDLHEHARQNYVKGKPRYISDPLSSCIRVLKYEDFKSLTPKVVQDILRDQHVLITGYPMELLAPTDEVQFDEAGLQLLKNLETSIPFQDQSIPVKDDYSVQLCTGTLEHVLESARKGGAIINALSFPLPLSEIRKSSFSSDVEAWLVTEGLPFCDQDATYPTGDVRWGLAATRGARHYIHTDCDGLATSVDVLCGEKLWFLYTPTVGFDLTNFGDTDHFFHGFDVTHPPEHWSVEAVCLQPGTRLLMKPNTPHAVFTTEHTIAVGGHFYSFGNIQQTFFGIVHAFVMDNLVTNTEHPKTRVLLFRMMQYLYKFHVEGADPKKNAALHLPALGTDMEAFVDLLTICNYCILSNLLDPRTYNFQDLQYGLPARASHLLQRVRHDYNALSPDDRRYFSFVRGLAINLIHWVNCHYKFEDRKGNSYDFITLARRYLHRQVKAIVAYKVKAESDNIAGVPNCTEEDVHRQAKLLFTAARLPEFQGLDLDDLSHAGTLTWESKHRYTPKMRAKPLAFTARDPLVLGTTQGDQMFHAGSAIGFPLTRFSVDDGKPDVAKDKPLDVVDDGGMESEEDVPEEGGIEATGNAGTGNEDTGNEGDRNEEDGNEEDGNEEEGNKEYGNEEYGDDMDTIDRYASGGQDDDDSYGDDKRIDDSIEHDTWPQQTRR